MKATHATTQNVLLFVMISDVYGTNRCENEGARFNVYSTFRSIRLYTFEGQGYNIE